MVPNDVATRPRASPSNSTLPLAHPKLVVNVGPIGLLADVALGYTAPRKVFENNTLPPIAHLTGEVRGPAPRRAPRLSPAPHHASSGWKEDAHSHHMRRSSRYQLPSDTERADPSHHVRGHHPSQNQHPHASHSSQPPSTQYWGERGEWYTHPPPHLAPTQSHASHSSRKHTHRSHAPHPYQRTQVSTGVGVIAAMGSGAEHLRPPSHPTSHHSHSSPHTVPLPAPAYTAGGERHIPPLGRFPGAGSGRGSASAPASAPASTPASSAPQSGTSTPCDIDPAVESEESSDESSDDEDEWTPSPKRRAPAPRTRASARLAVKRERDDSEIREVADEEPSASPSGSTSPVPDGKPKKRTYVRRDAQRRKEQNAQAQKKFRWKKKLLAEQMRADLDAQRALVEELRDRCAALEDMLGEHEAALAAAHEDNARLAARLEHGACACEG